MRARWEIDLSPGTLIVPARARVGTAESGCDMDPGFSVLGAFDSF
jgi:hypothetical protein